MTDTEKTFRNDKGAFDKYAWPGGYPIFYLMEDGGVICPDCANKESELIRVSREDHDKQWQIAAADINWEDASLYCDHCSQRIESAYAEPENN